MADILRGPQEHGFRIERRQSPSISSTGARADPSIPMNPLSLTSNPLNSRQIPGLLYSIRTGA